MAVPVPLLLMVRELNLGGTERQLTEIAKHLDRSQFEPHVGCFIPQGMRADELRGYGVPIVSIPVRSLLSPKNLIEAGQILARYIREKRIQIVHTFDIPATLFGVPAARLCRTPAVISSARAYRSLLTKKFQILTRMTDYLVDGIVVNSQTLANHLVERDGVRASLLHLCYNGLDAEVFRPTGENFREIVGGQGVNVGVLCALRPEKDLETLLRAFAEVLKKHRSARLIVVGSGPIGQALQETASMLAIAGSCWFEPMSADVAAWMRTMDIFVLPSQSEAFSNSLMEAMACGCCPVASRVGGNPELVEPEVTGLLFEPGNRDELAHQLIRLFDDAALRRGLAAAASQKVRSRFRVEEASRRMGEIYSDLLARRTASK